MAFELRPSDNPTGAVVPTRRHNSPWLYKHHATDWECVHTRNGWEWLPGLSRFHLRGGVGGIKLLKRGNQSVVDDSVARKNHRIHGWQIIETDNAAHPNYIKRVRTLRGWLHIDVWTSISFRRSCCTISSVA